MGRIELQEHPGVGMLTPDTSKALTELEARAAKAGLTIEATVKVGPQSPLGRSLSIKIDGEHESVSKLWMAAVPIGFTPWSRYPVRGTVNESLFFLGPWQGVLDRLCAEGRGHLAWSALCNAANLDVTLDLECLVEEELGAALVCFVQCQLHRLGLNPGAIDGILGTRTQNALTLLGAQNPTLGETAAYLSKLEQGSLHQPKFKSKSKSKSISEADGPWRGQVSGHGLVSIASHGQVAVVRTAQGAALTIEGPGRVIADFAPE